MQVKKLMFIIMIMLFGIYAFNGSFSKASSLEGYFRESGAEFVKSDVEGHAYIKSHDSDEKILVDIFNAMEYNGEYVIFKYDDFTQLKSTQEKLDILIKIKRMSNKNFSYVSINLSQANAMENINSIRRSISKAFSLYDTKPSFSSLIQGKFNKKMSPLQMNKLARNIFKENGGSSIKGMENDKIISVSGFIPAFAERVKAENRYVNLNVALRYSEANSCTYIWFGSPIISVEY